MFTPKLLAEFNELEFSIYNCITRNKERVPHMKIKELADEAHVSTATVLRFCKKLGCEGYSEFRLRYKEYLKNQQILLKDSRHIIFIGIGSSGILGKYGARYFSNIGRFSLYVEDPFLPILQDMTDHTVTIVLSESGATYQMLKLANQLKQKGSRLLAITNKADSPLAKLADCNISYYVPQLKANGTNITTQIPVVYILETLARKLYTSTEG